MVTDFCVICGTKENLHIHHIIPKNAPNNLKPIRGMDDPTNLLTLCDEHHGWIHGCKPNQFNQMKVLQMKGIRKAQKAGKKWGRKTKLDKKVLAEISSLREQGLSMRGIAKQLNISVATVHKGVHA